MMTRLESNAQMQEMQGSGVRLKGCSRAKLSKGGKDMQEKRNVDIKG